MLEDGVFDRVYKYNSDWTYTGISHYLDGSPKGIFWDGINWWVLGYLTSRVYQFVSQKIVINSPNLDELFGLTAPIFNAKKY